MERAWDFFFGVEGGKEGGDFDWTFIGPFYPFLCFNDLQIGGPFYTSWYLKLYLKLDFEFGNKGRRGCTWLSSLLYLKGWLSAHQLFGLCRREDFCPSII